MTLAGNSGKNLKKELKSNSTKKEVDIRFDKTAFAEYNELRELVK